MASGKGGKDVLRQGLRGPVMFGGPTPEVPPSVTRHRPAWAEVDLAALRHNVRLLCRLCSPAGLCAVVKADGYGHGAPQVAGAAIEAGAAGLAVALVEEGVELREAGVRAPVLVLSEPPVEAFSSLVAGGLTPTLCTPAGVAAAGEAARELGTRLVVHVKVDTGMHRVGAPLHEVGALLDQVASDPALRLQGLWTHLAVADGPDAADRGFTERQLARFDAVVASRPERPPLLHAANSAGALAWPDARYDLVRPGITLFGSMPGPFVAEAFARLAPGERLRPVLSLKARVAAVRGLDAAERPSYGRLRPLPTRSVVATVPLGYADGVPRGLFAGGGVVLIGGRRCPLAGMVTMDQVVVDCGPESLVAVGDEVVLLGRQGNEEITAEEWAERLGTISYEVLCGIGPRVPRVHLGGAREQKPDPSPEPDR